MSGSVIRARRPAPYWQVPLGGAIAFLCCLAGAIAIAPESSHAASGGGPRARSARELTVNDRTYLHLVGSPGIEVTENGTSYGTFSGSVASHLTLSGDRITGNFVLHTHAGLVVGSTHASVVGKAALPVVSFAGTVSLTRGTGSYSHMSGQISLKGSIRRKNYEVYEETSGRVHL
jgi:hypothetical protein